MHSAICNVKCRSERSEWMLLCTESKGNKVNKQCGRRVRPTRYAPARLNPDLWLDRLTLKLVRESHLRSATFIINQINLYNKQIRKPRKAQ